MMDHLNEARSALIGSLDPGTGQVYFPPRPLAADGSMRATETVELSTGGLLYSWTALGPVHYGQIDLPEGVRLQCEIVPGEHQIGTRYVLEASGDEGWRFRRA
ncbi:Zn-ribbon domain-containing OB-fold protein [Paracoccus sp. (in: a-proteobacteria)]|uniref:Zn-ribbon domain-containing OB-fold protein n=1 Tax=Paracoccus sp. TaxID=267 RepID=UPI003A8B4D62